MVEDKKVITDVVADDDKDADIDDSDESKINTADYIKKLKAEAKSYRVGKAALKKEYEDTKAKLDALEAEKLTDTEKKDKRIIELEKKLVDNEVNTNQAKTDNLILKAISGKNFVDVDVVSMLVNKELDSEEEIDEKVIVKIVDKLIKDKPYLISSGSVNPSDGNFKKQDSTIKKSPKEQLGEFIQGKIDKLS